MNTCKFLLYVRGVECEVDEHGVADSMFETHFEEEHTPALS